MYVFEYLRFNFKTQYFVMRLPIKAQIITQKCNAVHSRHENKIKIYSYNLIVIRLISDVRGYINFDLNFETVICQ